MPEGDTVHRAAARLHEVLANRTVTRCDIRVPAFATVDLTGEPVIGVEAIGKHLLMRIGDTTVHSHLKMEGSWHVYRPGSRWRRPAFEARMVLEVGPLLGRADGGGGAADAADAAEAANAANAANAADAADAADAGWQAVGFALGELELVPTRDEESIVGHLGPDPLGPTFDRDEAVRRLTADPDRAVGLALLDQRNVAGLGNDYRNEVLFLRGILPETPIGQTDVEAVLDLAVRLIRANRDRVERVTTGDLRKGRRLWVAHREHEPCRRCGTRIRKGMLGDDALTERQTFYCTTCQH
jgi:endonuclease VIII